MINKKVRFAVVGFGHIGRRHVEMIELHERAELTAVVDIDRSKEKNVVEKSVPFFTTIREFINANIEADVVCVATPNAYHANQAITLIKAGYHVVIEKPMALTTKDCNDIIDTAKRSGKHVFGVMQNRYSPPMQWMKQLIDKAMLGDIYMVNMACYWNRDDRYYTKDTWHGDSEIDGGTLFTQFSHYIDLLHWLFGDMNNISAKFANNAHKHSIDFEDTAFLNFDLEKGGSGTLSYTTAIWDKNMGNSMVVVGEKGSIKIGGQYMDKIEYYHIKDYELPKNVNSQPLLTNKDDTRANHYYVIQNVVDVLNGEGEITTKAEESVKVVDIIERIYALKK